MPGDSNVVRFPQRGPEHLSQNLQRVQNLNLNYTNDEFHAIAQKQAQTRSYDVMIDIKMTEDDFVGSLQTLIKAFYSGEKIKPDTLEGLLHILTRLGILVGDEKLKNNPNIQIFRMALQEVNEKVERIKIAQRKRR